MLHILADSFMRASHQNKRDAPRWHKPHHWSTPSDQASIERRKGTVR
ncbi:hypothetical protein [Planktotalea arctica]|nr:hypothetical protein [Planktotalea arctica]